MTIRTVHVCPPIPVRDYDWQAYDTDNYDPEDPDALVGWGSTEERAIANLMKWTRLTAALEALFEQREADK